MTSPTIIIPTLRLGYMIDRCVASILDTTDGDIRLWIGKEGTPSQVVNEAIARTVAAADLHTTCNSYFGLFRQATHSHSDRRRLARAALREQAVCTSAA